LSFFLTSGDPRSACASAVGGPPPDDPFGVSAFGVQSPRTTLALVCHELYAKTGPWARVAISLVKSIPVLRRVEHIAPACRLSWRKTVGSDACVLDVDHPHVGVRVVGCGDRRSRSRGAGRERASTNDDRDSLCLTIDGNHIALAHGLPFAFSSSQLRRTS